MNRNTANQFILFHSRNCEKSYEIIDILRQNEEANKQILKACLEDSNIQIPPFIRTMSTPILMIHKKGQPKPEIYQAQECFQAILHLINKLSFFPKHQQKNSSQSMPPSTPGSIPRIPQNQPNDLPPSNRPNSVSPSNGGAGGGFGSGPSIIGDGIMEYDNTRQLSGMYTMIGGDDVENHEGQYSFIDAGSGRLPGQPINGGGGESGGDPNKPKTKLDSDYETFIRQRDTGMPKPLERR
jgi:hypothetical protein